MSKSKITAIFIIVISIFSTPIISRAGDKPATSTNLGCKELETKQLALRSFVEEFFIKPTAMRFVQKAQQDKKTDEEIKAGLKVLFGLFSANYDNDMLKLHINSPSPEAIVDVTAGLSNIKELSRTEAGGIECSGDVSVQMKSKKEEKSQTIPVVYVSKIDSEKGHTANLKSAGTPPSSGASTSK